MIERIIISIVSILMLALTSMKGDKKTTLLTSGLTIGILITWIEIPIIITVGMIIYMLTALMISITSIKTKELTKFNQITITMTGIWACGINLFSILHLPYAELVRLSIIIPITLYLINLINGLIRRREFGYMSIMNVEFILRLIR